MLRIRLLGGFSLLYDDQPILIQSARLQLLIAYLVLHADLPHLRQRLAFLFWPDSSEPQAHTNMRKLIFQLRRALPNADRYVLLDQHAIQWRHSENYSLDVDELQQLLRQSKDGAVGPIPATKITMLYGAGLLAGYYDEWIVPLRQQLHWNVRQTLEQWIEMAESIRNYDDALLYAHHLLTLDPLEEASYRHLMRLMALKGDKNGVARVYQQCVKMLRDELDVEPSPETQQVYQHVEVEHPPASLVSEMLPLVGRVAAWNQLQAAWRQTLVGHAQLVIVSGEAGMGKTRLAEELLRWGNYAGAITARTRSYAVQGALTYAPIAELLRAPSINGWLSRVPGVWRVEMARLLPELLETDPKLLKPETIRESWQRQRFWEALARGVRGSGKQPLLLLLDDLQWCDHETLAWLQYLIYSEPRARLLVLGTVRDDEVASDHPLMMLQLELQRSGNCQQIALSALSDEESSELVRSVAQADVPAVQLARIAQEAEGNPLFIVEFARSQLLGEKHLVANVNTPVDSALSTLPPKVYATIRHRLLHLSPQAQELVSMAAVVGRSFSLELLHKMSGKDLHTLTDALDEAWRRRMIRWQNKRYDFTHDRIRDVAYATLGPLRQQRLHLLAAESLEALYADMLDAGSLQIAAHFEQAGRLQKAFGYFQRAALVAQNIYAYREAIRLLHHCLALLEQMDAWAAKDQVRLEVLTQLAFMLVQTEGTASARVREIFEQVRTRTQVAPIPQNFALLQGMSTYYRVRAEYGIVKELATQLLDIAVGSRHTQHLVAAHFELGAMHFLRGELLLAQSHLAASAQLCTVNQSYARPHSILAEVLWMLGFPEQAMAKYREALIQVREHATPFDLVAVLGDTIELRLVAGVTEELQEDIARLWETVQQYGYSQHGTWATFLQGWSLSTAQGLPRVEEMEQGVRSYQAIGGRTRSSRFLGLIAEQYLLHGEVARAAALWSEAMAYINNHDEAFWEAGLYLLKAKLLLVQQADGVAEAEQWMIRALDTARRQHAKMLELRATIALAELWLAQARTREGITLLESVMGWFTEGFTMPEFHAARDLLAQLTAAGDG